MAKPILNECSNSTSDTKLLYWHETNEINNLMAEITLDEMLASLKTLNTAKSTALGVRTIVYKDGFLAAPDKILNIFNVWGGGAGVGGGGCSPLLILVVAVE